MKYILLIIIICLSSCTQSFISYIKKVSVKPLISTDEILIEAGLVAVENKTKKNTVTPTNSTGVLISNSTQTLQTVINTLETSAGSKIMIKADTENYLIARPYFSSDEIIYNVENSNPAQGSFEFIIGNKSGMIKIRLYHPHSNLLIKEMTWYIELKESIEN
ncbi:MAG: hypothetical protein ACRCV0_07790 [Brevinema sp.]